MLDELFKAATAIEGAGISVKDWHPKFKPLPAVKKNAPCIRIWLDTEGHITDLESLSSEQVVKLRKFEPNNGQSFPGFNVRPLFIRILSNLEARKFSAEAVENLKAPFFDWDLLLRGACDLWAKDTVKTVDRILTKISADLKKRCEKKGCLSEDETLSCLFAAVEKMDALQFRTEYEQKLKSKIAEGTLPLSLLLFCGEEGKESKVSVFVDVQKYQDFPVGHEKTIARLNDLLFIENNPNAAPNSGRHLKDAYGADAAGSENLKMAQVAVPVLGGVFLRSQAKTIPAQCRYDLSEGETFTIGLQTRSSVKSALEWLSNPERNGKTYGVAGDRELLFAYPAKLPLDSCPELALLLGAQSDDDRKFADLAETVIGQLHGMGDAEGIDGNLEIFSLRKMDKARTKVVYYHNTTVASLEAASRDWDTGFKNIPPLDIRVWSDDKNEKGKSFPVSVAPQTLFPVKLHKILNTVWMLSRNELKQAKVKLFEPSTGLRLLLNVAETAQTAYVMERFLVHSQTYFIALCRARGRNEIVGQKDLVNLETYPGVLGLLLYKIGKTKENYMNESAFQLGRFLRVADEIHRLYCEVVRKREIPPELCGSSMLAATLENPTQALAQLCMRSAPYLRWARAYHGEDKGGLVHYWMRQWAPIADALHETNWAARPTAEDRAQIFLGYLSSFTKSEKPESTTESTVSTGEQQ